jgi:hypothetical protein
VHGEAVNFFERERNERARNGSVVFDAKGLRFHPS